MNNYLFGHTHEYNAYIVEDYPWGFRMRTQQKHWIETNPKLGDRHVAQTKDPRTGRWCNPKKSTYYAVMVLYLNDEGHIKSTAIHPSSTQADVDEFLSKVGAVNLSEAQQNQLKRIVALDKTMKHFTFTCEASPYNPINLTKVMNKDPEEMAKAAQEEERQRLNKEADDRAKHQMGKIFSYYMSQ